MAQMEGARALLRRPLGLWELYAELTSDEGPKVRLLLLERLLLGLRDKYTLKNTSNLFSVYYKIPFHFTLDCTV